MNNLFVVVDATNQGSFSHLTRHRVPGAMPFGAKYRLIDFTLSNCKNSKIYNVAIFPYGNYRSLSDQIGSGNRWDLNRRKDGIFILPPKVLTNTIDHEISFQRMYEHIEYFKRSSQEYALITPANVVINIDYMSLLDKHIDADLDLSTFVGSDYERLKIYIINKELLIDYISKYDQIQYRNLSDVFDFSSSLKKAAHRIEQSSFLIESSRGLFNANMQLMNEQVRQEIFIKDWPIYSKETMSAPTRYGESAVVKNSIIASGAVIEGEVYHSVIGRKVHVRKNAKVYHSVLMNHADIGENAQVQYSILDKETKVIDHAKVLGTIDQLFVSEKKQIVTTEKGLTILQVSAEVQPFMKTGGLADVVGANAEAYSSLGKKSLVIMPMYPKIFENYELLLKHVGDKTIDFGDDQYKASLYALNNENTVYYFIETYQFFDRDKIYGYPDDDERFAFFSLAVIDFLEYLESFPNVIHVHDWHSALIPMLLKEYGMKIKTLLTIHNIEYQGKFTQRVLSKLKVKTAYNFFRPNALNFLETGIHLADKVSTVSETYKDELAYEYYSKNLVDAIQRRARDFYGILNGVSENVGPKNDLDIYQKYDLVNVFSAKPRNKEDLQKKLGLTLSKDFFIIGMVTRIVEQKGFDIILPALYEILKNPQIQFVILGTGQEKYLDNLRNLEKQFPNQVSVNLTYDATNPNYIYAGADLFLMPSRVEPCGLGQMIALKYGTIPLVRQTGGLNDTVDHYDLSSKRGNGFKFYNFDVRDLVFQLEFAYSIYKNHPNDWHQLIINAMNSRFTIKDSAIKYIELYEMMV
ncbi:glycosyltransferase [Hujiaoplasma nucleasis]|uniref:Glycogen synthase n=1 Tax=Hujiaoplasma nucleasis TaxID=2725268 RepID=A0A7L6N452_9MOLU|nr:glycogen/starch synthase [Hujiaoplasma nucleasis]QLY40027.1 glycosyltransferase [Hujiaoplasma nucleasis]